MRTDVALVNVASETSLFRRIVNHRDFNARIAACARCRYQADNIPLSITLSLARPANSNARPTQPQYLHRRFTAVPLTLTIKAYCHPADSCNQYRCLPPHRAQRFSLLAKFLKSDFTRFTQRSSYAPERLPTISRMPAKIAENIMLKWLRPSPHTLTPTMLCPSSWG